MMNGPGAVCQMLQGETQGRYIRKGAAGRLAEEDFACSLCRRHCADIQCVLDHITPLRIQLNLCGGLPVPADISPPAAPLPPKQAGTRLPPHFLPLAGQLKGAFFTGQHSAWNRAGWR